jgi:hypothetical protein
VEERATTADAQDKDRLGSNRKRGALVVVAVEVMREAILNDASFMEWDELGQLCVCVCVCVHENAACRVGIGKSCKNICRVSSISSQTFSLF